MVSAAVAVDGLTPHAIKPCSFERGFVMQHLWDELDSPRQDLAPVWSSFLGQSFAAGSGVIHKASQQSLLPVETFVDGASMQALVSVSRHFHHGFLRELMSLFLGRIHRVHWQGCSPHECLRLGPFRPTPSR